MGSDNVTYTESKQVETPKVTEDSECGGSSLLGIAFFIGVLFYFLFN